MLYQLSYLPAGGLRREGNRLTASLDFGQRWGVLQVGFSGVLVVQWGRRGVLCHPFSDGTSMQQLNIQFEDLFSMCPTCHGAGFVEESPLSAAGDRMETEPHSGPCAVCGGKGGELTDSGLAIKRLLEKLDAGA